MNEGRGNSSTEDNDGSKEDKKKALDTENPKESENLNGQFGNQAGGKKKFMGPATALIGGMILDKPK